MKKSLLKLICGVFAISLLFSSCLGDSSSEESYNGVFAYITTRKAADGQSAQIVAAANGIYFTSNYIQTLTVGKCYLLSLRFDYANHLGNYIYQADDTAVPSELQQSRASVVSGSISMDDAFNPTDFAPHPYALSYSNYFGDNWGVYFTATLKEKDTPVAYAFYDVDKQYEEIDGVRKDVGKNQIILDIRFANIPGADSGTEKSTGYLTVLNLSDIRNEYLRYVDFGGKSTVDVNIKFRYNQLQSDKTIKSDVYVGSWNETMYAFRYINEEIKE